MANKICINEVRGNMNYPAYRLFKIIEAICYSLK
jgi:hypothetical protein